MKTVRLLSKFLSIAVTLAALVAVGADLGFARKQPVEIIMKGLNFHVKTGGVKDTTRPGFTLTAGEVTEVTVINDDSMAHSFMSPLFEKTDVTISGEATAVSHNGVSGYRLEPGNRITFRFKPPVNEAFDSGYDVFWCDIHGKRNMRGEVLIVDTRVGVGGF